MSRWLAALYDPCLAVLENAYLREERGALLSGVTGRVIELGAGTGLNLPHYRADVSLVATEPDPSMLARARTRGAPRLDSVCLTECSAEELPFSAASFDHAVGTLVFCTIPNPERALAEVARVLRPGGQLHLIEHERSAQSALGRIQDLVTPLWKHVAGGCHLNRDVLALVKRAGFQVTQARHIPPSPRLLPMRVIQAQKV